jgi:site-specific recombinase XerD
MKRSVYSGKPLVKSSGIRIKPLNQRSLVIFHNAIKSEKTQKSYDQLLGYFMKYYNLNSHKDFDTLISWNPKELQTRIEDYVMYLRSENKSYSWINTLICSLKLFFSMNDVILNWTKLKKLLPERKKPMCDKPYSTEQIRQILKNTSNPKYRAMIHLMSNAGVRVGSFEELRMKDIQDYKDGCKSITSYGDDLKEYTTFITPEGSQALDEYFEFRKKNGDKLTSDSWVFTSTNQDMPITSDVASTEINRIVQNAITRKKINGRFEIASCHGFRRRFATVLKSNKEINLSISEKLMGHSTSIQLDNTYFKPSLEVMFDEYRKAIPELAIDESAKLRLELEKKNQKLSSVEVKDRRIEQLEDVVSSLEKSLNELKSRF